MRKLIPYAGAERRGYSTVDRTIDVKKQRRSAPIDHILDLWKAGYTRGEIVRVIGPIDGALLQDETITRIIVRARRDGDPRALTRR